MDLIGGKDQWVFKMSDYIVYIYIICGLLAYAAYGLLKKFFFREILSRSVAFSVCVSLWKQLWLMIIPSSHSIRWKMNSKKNSASVSISAFDVIRVLTLDLLNGGAADLLGTWFILLCWHGNIFHLAVRPFLSAKFWRRPLLSADALHLISWCNWSNCNQQHRSFSSPSSTVDCFQQRRRPCDRVYMSHGF